MRTALVVLAALALLWLALVAVLAIAGRRSDARALAVFVPACVVLVSRLAADRRLPGRHRLLLVGLAAYLALPLDLVPDFVPVAGQLDDAIAVALVLRLVVRAAGSGLVREHWPGDARGLAIVLRLAGV